MPHYLDWMYLCSTLNRPLFQDGWGDIFEQNPGQFRPVSPDQIKVPEFPDLPDLINGSFRKSYRDGLFSSPYRHQNFPKECANVPFRVCLARKRPMSLSEQKFTILIPASGDAGYGQRQGVANLLQKSGINVIMAEGPYYGKRKPSWQSKTSLKTVGDLGHLGTATILETQALIAWLYRQEVRKMSVAGISRGGQLAMITAAMTRYPLAVTCAVGSFHAGPIFTEGLMSKRVSWQNLRHPLGSVRAMNYALRFSDVSRYHFAIKDRARVHLIGARSDGYVKPEWVSQLRRHIPESSIEWVDGGHVAAFLFAKNVYVKGIVTTLERI